MANAWAVAGMGCRIWALNEQGHSMLGLGKGLAGCPAGREVKIFSSPELLSCFRMRY